MTIDPMSVEFIAGFSPIVADPAVSSAFYRDALGLSFEGGEGDYVFTEQMAGAKQFGLWPLREAAQACSAQTSGRLTFRHPKRAWSSRSPT